MNYQTLKMLKTIVAIIISVFCVGVFSEARSQLKSSEINRINEFNRQADMQTRREWNQFQQQIRSEGMRNLNQQQKDFERESLFRQQRIERTKNFK